MKLSSQTSWRKPPRRDGDDRSRGCHTAACSHSSIFFNLLSILTAAATSAAESAAAAVVTTATTATAT